MARANPLRFSTKYQDDETDLLYYGYRYYNASMARWLSRDPLEEDGANNLYAASVNDLADGIDPLGKAAIFLGFGYDTSVENISQTHNLIARQSAFFYRMIIECIGKKHDADPCKHCELGEAPALWRLEDKDQSRKKAPEDSDYRIDAPPVNDDVKLAEANFREIKVGSVPVLFTRKKIFAVWLSSVAWGWGETGVGVLLRSSPLLPSHTLAHELGHYADYRGDVDFGAHSSAPGNLMNPVPSTSSKPDCQWCQKVFALGRE